MATGMLATELKPIGATSHGRLVDELKQVKDDHAQVMRDLSVLAKQLQAEVDSYRKAVAGTKPPVGAQTAVDKLAALIACLPQ